MTPLLIALAGLPGVGKTTIARGLACEFDATHVRVDTIEQAIRESASLGGDLDDAGYRIAYRVAEDNLRLGRSVVADSVNPWPLTRKAWRAVGARAAARVVDVEVVCSDRTEHRRRIEERGSDIAGLRLPTWQDVMDRDYRPWTRDRIVHDTAGLRPADSIAAVAATIRQATG